MKKIVYFLIAVVAMMCLFVFCVSAYQHQLGDTGIYYETNLYNYEITITDANKSIVKAEIPDIIEGNPVVEISDSAFEGCTSLTTITIPESVEVIGKNAFANTAYYNDESNWNDGLLYIGNCFISAKADITEIALKEGTKVIADSAFLNCSGLEEVTVPDSVTNIGDYVFSGCVNLRNVNLPDCVVPSHHDHISNSSIKNVYFRRCTLHEQEDPIWMVAVYMAENIYILNKETRIYDTHAGYSGGYGCNFYVYHNSKALEYLKGINDSDIGSEVGKREYKINTLDEHTNKVLAAVTEPTCTETGYTGNTVCEGCGYIFESGEVIEKLPHTYTEKHVEPTCMDFGYDEKSCSCGDTVYKNYIPVVSYQDDNNDDICDFCSKPIKDIPLVYGFSYTYDKDTETLYINYNPDEDTREGEEKGLFDGVFLKEGDYPFQQRYTNDDASWLVNPATKIVFGEGITEILDCWGLHGHELWEYDFFVTREIVCPSSLLRIGEGTFIDFMGLKTVKLNDGLEYIGNYAFAKCFSLENIEIPESVKYIGLHAFSEALARNISVLSKDTFIGEGAFGYGSYINDKFDALNKNDEFIEYYHRYVEISDKLNRIGVLVDFQDDRPFIYNEGICTDEEYESLIKEQKELVEILDGASEGETSEGLEPRHPWKLLLVDVWNDGEKDIYNYDYYRLYSDSTVIRGYRNSTAEAYAKENEITFIPLDACTHENITVENSLSATCTTEGYSGDKICTDCGETVEVGTVIEKSAHSYTTVVTAPTCTSGGYTTYTCSACGDTYVGNKTGKTPHTEKVVNAAKANCTSEGYTGDVICSVCNTQISKGKIIEKTNHRYTTKVDGSETISVCEICGDSTVITCKICKLILTKNYNSFVSPLMKLIDIIYHAFGLNK